MENTLEENMTRRELFQTLSEAVIEDPTLMPVALEALSHAAQNIAGQHRGVRRMSRTVKYLDKLSVKLQAELDDAHALMPEGLS
jgi:hypothetical protein